MRVFVTLLDRFVPAAIRQHSHEQLMRARVLVTALLLGCVVSVLAELPSLLLPRQNASGQLIGVLVTLVIVGFYIGCLVILKRTASLALAGNLYGFSVYFGITSAVALTGGFEKSPFLQIPLLIPLFLFLICGRRWGYVWTLVIIVTYTVFYALSLAHIELPNLAVTPYQDAVVFALWVLLCFSLMLCLAIYDAINENLATRIRSERDKFEHEAAHDILTGLANRRTYHRVLEQNIESCRESGNRLALLIIDLNGFKPINDRLGHHAGDVVLQVIAQRLKKAVRDADTVARLGGDEFSVILHAINDQAMVSSIAHKIQQDIAEPIPFEHQQLSVHASIGIACYPENGEDPDALTRHADHAMYSVKQADGRTPPVGN